MDASRGFETWWAGRGLPENMKAAFFMVWKAALDSDADAQDAARYRYLRNASLNDERELDVCDDVMNVFFGEDLDMAIDDAVDHAATLAAAPGEDK